MANVEAATTATQPLSQRLANTLAQTCASAHNQQIEASLLFLCRDLPGHTDGIAATEFSEDGTLLVSGGFDNTVRLWSLNQGRNGGGTNSTMMDTRHERGVSCLYFSPDNNRIFSGGNDKMIFIHDTRTLVESNSFSLYFQLTNLFL